MRPVVPPDVGPHSYVGTSYANPDAVTQIANGLSTTTYAYDNNGNLAQKTTDGTTTTYVWDYANRLIALGTKGATSTYGYDAFGSRVFQKTATSTTLYPFKYFSVASTTSGTTSTSTTEYVFNGDILVATIDQTGTSTTSGGAGASTSTPAYVQSKKDSANGVVTLNNSVTNGDLIVVGLTIWNTTIPSNAISDNKGNTYTKIAEAINSSSQDHAAIFYAKNVTGGSSFTVTSSVGGTVAAHEYSGVSTSSPLDLSHTGTGLSTIPNSGNVTTSIGSRTLCGSGMRKSWAGRRRWRADRMAQHLQQTNLFSFVI